MLKLHHHIGQTVVFIACSIAVVGCDSTVTMYDPLLEMTVEERRRVLAVYAEYWPLISSEEQHKRLPDVLIDTIPELRVFGIERVAMLLRDGEALEEELWRVVTRLRDRNHRVRLCAAELLPEINVTDLFEYEKSPDGSPTALSKFVADSLVLERNQRVAALELAFFQTRPHEDAVDPTIDRLKRGPVDSAARTLFVLLNAELVDDVLKSHIFKIVQRSPQHRKLPSLITLEARLGDSKVQDELIYFLESEDRSLAMAVIRGFAAAGKWEPLIPFWEDSRSESFLERKTIALLSAPLLIEVGQSEVVLQLLEDGFEDPLIDEDLLALRFKAAITASKWNTAEDTRPEPGPWIKEYENAKIGNKPTEDGEASLSDDISEQILERFENELTQEQKESLGIVHVEATPDQNP